MKNKIKYYLCLYFGDEDWNITLNSIWRMVPPSVAVLLMAFAIWICFAGILMMITGNSTVSEIGAFVMFPILYLLSKIYTRVGKFIKRHGDTVIMKYERRP